MEESDLAPRAPQIKQRPCSTNTYTWAFISVGGVNRSISLPAHEKCSISYSCSVLSMHAMQRPVYLQPIDPARARQPAGKAWAGKSPDGVWQHTTSICTMQCTMHHVTPLVPIIVDCSIKTRATKIDQQT